jgi:hypothetical protein
MTTHARTDQDSPGHFDVGASRQAAARHRTAIQHEISRLFDDLAPLAVPGRRAAPEVTVATHRWPNRCILQGPTHAVSLTWFAGTRDDESLGELLVMTWRGRVSLPGSASRERDEAEVIVEETLHPAWTLAGGWGWRAEGSVGDDAVRSTDDLIAECRRALEAGALP